MFPEQRAVSFLSNVLLSQSRVLRTVGTTQHKSEPSHKLWTLGNDDVSI